MSFRSPVIQSWDMSLYRSFSSDDTKAWELTQKRKITLLGVASAGLLFFCTVAIVLYWLA
jgi:hypothetical protein